MNSRLPTRTRLLARATRVVFLLSVLCVTRSGSLPAQNDELWTFERSAFPDARVLSPTGDLLLFVDGDLIALAGETGTPRWTREKEDLRDIDRDRIDVLPLTPFAVFWPGDQVLVLDLRTGASQWSSAALGLRDVRSLGTPAPGTLVMTGVTPSDSLTLVAVELFPATVRTVPLPLVKDLVLLGFPTPETALLWGARSDSRREVVLVDLRAAVIEWRSDTMFREKPEYGRKGERRVFDSARDDRDVALIVRDSVVVLYVTKAGPTAFDLGSGRVVWRAEAFRGEKPHHEFRVKPTSDSRNHFDRFPRMVAGVGAIYVPDDKKIAALQFRDGSLLWRTPRDLLGRVYDMAPLAHGLLVHTQRNNFRVAVQLLDPETGEVRELAEYANFAPTFLGPDTLLVADAGGVSAIDLAALTMTALARYELVAEGLPLSLERSESTLTVLSGQDLITYSHGGVKRYHVSYRAPGRSLLDQMVRTALIVGLGVARAHAQTFDPMFAPPPLPFTYAEMDSVLQHRFASARTASRYAYIYTDEPDGERTGFSLVQIDKASGRPTGRVWLDERRPEYIIDPFTGTVFHMANMWGPTEIRAYQFPHGDGGQPRH